MGALLFWAECYSRAKQSFNRNEMSLTLKTIQVKKKISISDFLKLFQFNKVRNDINISLQKKVLLFVTFPLLEYFF